MSRTSDIMNSKRMTLIVSIPDNSEEMARACADNGADAVKVHINVQHAVSGRKFGNLEDERPRLEKVLSVGLPVGIVPGENLWLDVDEVREMAQMGFDYIDVFAHFMPAHLLAVEGIGKEVAVGTNYSLAAIRSFDVLPVDAVDAAIIGPEGYRKPLSVDDLTRYRAIVEATVKPVVVPTDRTIRPEDVESLAMIGVKGLMIGVASVGTSLSSIEGSVREFRKAIDQLG
jgi:hypothetical protein